VAVSLCVVCVIHRFAERGADFGGEKPALRQLKYRHKEGARYLSVDMVKHRPLNTELKLQRCIFCIYKHYIYKICYLEGKGSYGLVSSSQSQSNFVHQVKSSQLGTFHIY
jgi:hypothetical protein